MPAKKKRTTKKQPAKKSPAKTVTSAVLGDSQEPQTRWQPRQPARGPRRG